MKSTFGFEIMDDFYRVTLEGEPNSHGKFNLENYIGTDDILHLASLIINMDTLEVLKNRDVLGTTSCAFRYAELKAAPIVATNAYEVRSFCASLTSYA